MQQNNINLNNFQYNLIEELVNYFPINNDFKELDFEKYIDLKRSFNDSYYFRMD